MTVIETDAFVTIHYDLCDPQGNLLRSSRPDEPITFQQGHHQIVPGLEQALAGRSVGEQFEVSLVAEEAYGPVDPEKSFWVDRSVFPPGRLEVGQFVELTPEEDGPAYMGKVVAVNKREVEVDANHPLAGQDVTFKVEILAAQAHSPLEEADGDSKQQQVADDENGKT